jgi:hypothetical protein
MTPKEALRLLESIHNYYHKHCRPFYDKGVMDADILICVAASDMRNPNKPALLPAVLSRY